VSDQVAAGIDHGDVGGLTEVGCRCLTRSDDAPGIGEGNRVDGHHHVSFLVPHND
jgi:hypothetical protein